MESTTPVGSQAKLWNGAGGRAWVETQPLLDHMYKPIEALLVDAVSARRRRRVLDVGCGTGGTTVAIQRALGADGYCVGIDISEPMIAAAQARAEQGGIDARFVCASAQDHKFEAGTFDAIVSRFGVMFFDDPDRAFANLRHAARANADLHFVAWRSAGENPFMTTAERAAAPLLPNLPARIPGAPGQFGLADRRRISSILQAGGWEQIDTQPIDIECSFPAADLVLYVTRLGPVGMVLHDVDDETRGHVVDAMRTAFAPYVHGSEVRFTAACWKVVAQSGGRATSVDD
jgi:SAM-dependent methyltransferase